MELENTKYKKYLSDFTVHLKAMDLSSGPTYFKNSVHEFLLWLEDNDIQNMNKLKGIDLQEFYDYLSIRPKERGEGTLSTSTLNDKMLALKYFFEMLFNQNEITKTYRLPKIGKRDTIEREPFSIGQIKELFDVAKTKEQKVLLSLAYGCGLRRSEIRTLKVGDINLQKGVLTVTNGKYNKRRQVMMSDAVVQNLKDYLNTDRIHRLKQHNFFEDSVLLNNWGQPYSCTGIGKLQDSITKLLDWDRVPTLHDLRHSIATHLIEAGMPIQRVQKLLGHSIIDTSHIYSKRRHQNRIFKI